MKRTELISYLNKRDVDIEKCLQLIAEYCIDNNKNQEYINHFLDLLLMNPILLSTIYKVVFRNVLIKYNIHRIIKNHKVILYY